MRRGRPARSVSTAGSLTCVHRRVAGRIQKLRSTPRGAPPPTVTRVRGPVGGAQRRDLERAPAQGSGARPCRAVPAGPGLHSESARVPARSGYRSGPPGIMPLPKALA